jgi:hypothetical protein
MKYHSTLEVGLENVTKELVYFGHDLVGLLHTSVPISTSLEGMVENADRCIMALYLPLYQSSYACRRSVDHSTGAWNLWEAKSALLYSDPERFQFQLRPKK